MTRNDDHGKAEWENGYDGHSHAQMRRLAQLPFPLKLEWLEAAHRLVLQMEEARRTGRRAKGAGVPLDPDRD